MIHNIRTTGFLLRAIPIAVAGITTLAFPCMAISPSIPMISGAELMDVQAGSNSPVCAGDTLRLNASGGVSYVWSGPGGFTSTQQNPIIPNATTARSGLYKVVATDAAGLRDSAEVNVLVRPAPMIQLADTTFFCPGENIILPATGGTAPLQYAILGDPYQDSNNLGPRVSGSFSGIVRDANGCADTTFVQVRMGPRITNVVTTSVSCSNPTGSITVSATGADPVDYSIDNGATFQPMNSFVGLAPGNYTVTVRDGNGCRSTRSVTIPQLPVLLITGVETMPAACGNANGSLTINVAGGTAPVRFSIHPDSLPQSGNFFPNLRPGSYAVEARDNAGCVAAQTVTVPNAPCEFYIPNAFSPNDDGINDVLQVYGDAVLTSAVVQLYQVFDRWGGLVYEAKDFPFLSSDRWWGGKIKGDKHASAGLYTYYVVIAVNAEEIIRLSGEVSLMR